ncbi:uncharacterized protein LOC127857477 [Dreissena polymorpha]|nr:uncharacterized protein LOC127857477 [Dreissena polymorpha]
MEADMAVVRVAVMVAITAEIATMVMDMEVDLLVVSDLVVDTEADMVDTEADMVDLDGVIGVFEPNANAHRDVESSRSTLVDARGARRDANSSSAAEESGRRYKTDPGLSHYTDHIFKYSNMSNPTAIDSEVIFRDGSCSSARGDEDTMDAGISYENERMKKVDDREKRVEDQADINAAQMATRIDRLEKEREARRDDVSYLQSQSMRINLIFSSVPKYNA